MGLDISMDARHLNSGLMLAQQEFHRLSPETLGLHLCSSMLSFIPRAPVDVELWGQSHEQRETCPVLLMTLSKPQSTWIACNERGSESKHEFKSDTYPSQTQARCQHLGCSLLFFKKHCRQALHPSSSSLYHPVHIVPVLHHSGLVRTCVHTAFETGSGSRVARW